jgi:hypothetical protein
MSLRPQAIYLSVAERRRHRFQIPHARGAEDPETQRANGSKVMKGRPIKLEEFERMLSKVSVFKLVDAGLLPKT